MKKTFEETLPEGYTAAKVVDAASKKLGIALNLAALLVIVLISLPAALILKPWKEPYELNAFLLLAFCAILIIYLVLHELTHGLVYKIMTGRKLRFGLSATVAYCGVPDVYVYRKTALLSLAAPLVVFTIVFSIPLFFLQGAWEKLLCVILLATHIGGCSGDIYDIFLYLTKFRDPETLMSDTGPEQTFYTKK